MSDVETGVAESVDLSARLLAIAAKVVDAADGRVRLAHNEEDSTSDAQPEAAHFLKVDGERLGRDIEVYAFMGRVDRDITAVADFLGGVALPLDDVLDPKAHAAIMADVEQLGADVCPEELLEGWRGLFAV